MARYVSWIILSALWFLAACAPQAVPTVTVAPLSTATPTAEPTPVGRAANFDAARAFEHARKLAVDLGSRAAGTDGNASAANYIAREFEADGLQVTRQPFTFESWQDHGTTVRLLAPETKTLQAQALEYSPGGKVESALVLVPGIGSRDDFAKVNARDKIALVKRGTLPFAVKAANAAEVGAKALLIYNDQPQIFTGVLHERVEIPVIGLSGADGAELLQALSAGAVRVQLDSATAMERRTGYNIIGTLPGASAETIVLGGHYDSVSAGPGAGDNASGTATLLELARVMGAQPPPQRTMVFIAFDAEELGLLGSRAYVENLSDAQLAATRAMLNFDMLGAGGGPLLLMGDGKVGLLARASAQQLGIDARNGSLPANASSDHESFARRGIDTVFFMRDYNLLHTPDDTIDQIRPEFLDEAGRVAQRVLERLDAAPRSDSSLRLSPSE